MVSWRIIRYIATHQEKWDALDRALVYCINHGIFSGISAGKTKRDIENVVAGMGII